jgi:hypothetical protein
VSLRHEIVTKDDLRCRVGCGSLADPELFGRCTTCADFLLRNGYDRSPPPVVEGSLASTQEVCQVTELTARQVDYAVRSGRVKPTVEATGSGTRRGWTVRDAASLVVCVTARHHNLDINYRNPPRSVSLGPGMVVSFDLEEIEDHILRRWPENRVYDLPGGRGGSNE